MFADVEEAGPLQARPQEPGGGHGGSNVWEGRCEDCASHVRDRGEPPGRRHDLHQRPPLCYVSICFFRYSVEIQVLVQLLQQTDLFTTCV